MSEFSKMDSGVSTPRPERGTKPTPASEEPVDMVVFIVRRAGKCGECGTEFFPGAMIRMENEQPFCLACADLGHLEYLPPDNPALTRRRPENACA
jgi:hypothetical protein